MSDWYVSIRAKRRLGYFDVKAKTEPLSRRRRGHGWGHSYLRGWEGRARWGTSINQRTERWTSSRFRAFKAQTMLGRGLNWNWTCRNYSARVTLCKTGIPEHCPSLWIQREPCRDVAGAVCCLKRYPIRDSVIAHHCICSSLQVSVCSSVSLHYHVFLCDMRVYNKDTTGSTLDHYCIHHPNHAISASLYVLPWARM